MKLVLLVIVVLGDFETNGLHRFDNLPSQHNPSNQRIPLSFQDKKRLAETMKRNFHEYRSHLQETIEKEKEAHAPLPSSYHKQTASEEFLARYPPITFTSKNRPSTTEIQKLQRSAGEGPPGLRPSGLQVESHVGEDHFSGLLVPEEKLFQEENSEENSELLDSRLGPKGTSSFDPSIVVDFRLLSLSQKPQSSEHNLYEKTRNHHITLTENKTSKDRVSPRAVASTATVQELIPASSRNSSLEEYHEPMSVYVASDIELPKETSNSRESTFRGTDMSKGMLPQSVRDSLRKYLKPLLSALKPLTKSVPGLPGLDYPILSVVPYTNFYCSNMPWPGFYADTEARCQTWHACDVDGRQSSFLCPNGTIFNQALMVCDWWYNSDCLTAPFLYSLNERLFGHLTRPQVTPYRRITPQLLDTIFT